MYSDQELRRAARDGAQGNPPPPSTSTTSQPASTGGYGGDSSAFTARRQAELRNRGVRQAAIGATEASMFGVKPMMSEAGRNLRAGLQNLSQARNQTVLGAQLRNALLDRDMQLARDYHGMDQDYWRRGFQQSESQKQANQFGLELAARENAQNADRSQRERFFDATRADNNNQFNMNRLDRNDQFDRTFNQRQGAMDQDQSNRDREYNWRSEMYGDEKTRYADQQARQKFGDQVGLMGKFTQESVQAALKDNDPSKLVPRPREFSDDDAQALTKHRDSLGKELNYLQEKVKGEDGWFSNADPADLARIESIQRQLGDIDTRISSHYGLGGQQGAGGIDQGFLDQNYKLESQNFYRAQTMGRGLMQGIMNNPQAPQAVKDDLQAQMRIMNDRNADPQTKQMAMYKLDMYDQQMNPNRRRQRGGQQEYDPGMNWRDMFSAGAGASNGDGMRQAAGDYMRNQMLGPGMDVSMPQGAGNALMQILNRGAAVAGAPAARQTAEFHNTPEMQRIREYYQRTGKLPPGFIQNMPAFGIPDGVPLSPNMMLPL